MSQGPKRPKKKVINITTEEYLKGCLKRARKALRLCEDRYMESVAVNHMQRREVDKLQADVANFKAAIVQCVEMALKEVKVVNDRDADTHYQDTSDLETILEGIKQSATVVIG